MAGKWVRWWVVSVAFVVLPSISAGPAAAQAPVSSMEAQRLTLYLDCQTGGCDRDFFRRNIAFVDWVRNPADANVYVLVTSQQTGGGGRRYTLAFNGHDAFDGQDLELMYTSTHAATDDARRQGLLRVLELGLAPYVAGTPAAAHLALVYDAPEGKAAPVAVQRGDPWDSWVFEVGVQGSLDGEASDKSFDFGGSLSADRITPAWKHTVYVQARYRGESATYEDDSGSHTVEDIRRRFSISGMDVRSVASHWAVGVASDANSSTRDNRDFEVAVGPALEYNLFPYSEFARRQLLATYVVSSAYVDYAQVTVYDKLQQTLFHHSVTLAYGATQPWGEARVSLRGAQYLNDPSKYSVHFGGRLQLRLTRGFSVSLRGNAAWVRDQLGIAKESGSLEDVLLQRRNLATSYRYNFGVELSYDFGSIFNNVVNPRLDDLGDWY